MSLHRYRRGKLSLAVTAASFVLATVQVQAQTTEPESVLEEVFVTATSVAYGNTTVTESMKSQQSPITSVNALIDNLPGVSIQEGDSYGFDDWSTTIAVRGFQNSLSEQQIGTTID
ncbi:MAG: TonB-dependent receptor, partial [Congregibacter sp.]|nr:TonB-dependent receptor [Congregibacter sp.]